MNESPDLREKIAEVRTLVVEVSRAQATVLEKIEQTSLRTHETATNLAVLTDRMASLAQSVERLSHVVRGNGVEGIAMKVTRLSDEVSGLRDEQRLETDVLTKQGMLKRDAFYKYIVWLAGIVSLLVAQAVWEYLKRQ